MLGREVPGDDVGILELVAGFVVRYSLIALGIF